MFEWNYEIVCHIYYLANMSIKSIVAVGASAGGLEALKDLLSGLPRDLVSITYIIAQHISPNHKSMLVQLLSRETGIEVVEARDGMELMPSTIYITPPDSEISLSGNLICLRRPRLSYGPKPSVDVLFQSLAVLKDTFLIGVILSGTGSDGSDGARALKEAGGMLLVQDPSTAKYDGMPFSAIDTGLADSILPPGRMGEEIKRLIEGTKPLPLEEKAIEEQEPALKRLFQMLSIRSGTDFANYKPTTISRRIAKRLNSLGITDLEDYLEYVRANNQELDELFNSILIGVTKFFRDTDSFDALTEHVSQLLSQKKAGENIRVWVPGCATGEEPYSIAMMLWKLTRDQKERPNIQVFATDIDERAIAVARKGIYPVHAIENLGEDLIAAHFVQKGGTVELSKAIRSMVLFSRHDITGNPPFLRLDLISCRNLLIYFGQELQKSIMPLFHYSLLPGSLLFLGKSETIGEFNDLFTPLDSKHKLFVKKTGNARSSIKFRGWNNQKQMQVTLMGNERRNERATDVKSLVKDSLLATYDHPYVVVDTSFEIQELSGDLRDYLTMPQGNMTLNLLKYVHPDLLIELRSLLSNLFYNNEKILFGSIRRIAHEGGDSFVQLVVRPLRANLTGHGHAMVSFEKKENAPSVIEGTDKMPIDLRTDYEAKMADLEQDLSATKEHLQTYIEEIETSNEELQSLNEELQSTNEELQSTNEELETNNEELQSTNEEIQIAYNELRAANEELERKEQELKKANTLFNALFESSQQGNILIEPDFRIGLVNARAADLLLGLETRPPIVGKNILEIVPDEIAIEFLAFLRSAIVSKQLRKQVFEMADAKGSKFLEFCITTVPGPSEAEIKYFNIGILDLTSLYEREKTIFEKDEMLTSLLESNTTYLVRTDMEGRYTYANLAFCQKFGFEENEIIGHHFAPTVHPDDIPELNRGVGQLFESPNSISTIEIRKPDPAGNYFKTQWEMVAIKDAKGHIVSIQCMGRDITDERNAQQTVIDDRDQLDMMVKSGRLGTWDFDVPTGKIVFNAQWAEMLGFGKRETNMGYAEWKSLVHPEDIYNVEKALDDCLHGRSEYYSVEHRKTTKSGEVKWMLASGKVQVKGDNGKAVRIVGIHQDISALKEAEVMAEALGNRNTAILEAMQEGAVIQDADGRIISANGSAEKILGLSFDQMRGLRSVDPNWKCIHEDGSEFPGQDHPAMVTLQTGLPQENVIMGVSKPDGQVSWISINSVPLVPKPGQEGASVCTIFHDITDIVTSNRDLEFKNQELLLSQRSLSEKLLELNLAQAHIVDNERRLHELINAMPVGIYWVDQNGSLEFYNETCVAIWGCDCKPGQAEPCQVPITIMLASPDSSGPGAIDEGIKQLLASDVKKVHLEGSLKSMDGTQKFYYCTLTKTHGPQSETTGVLVTLVDATYIKQIEKEKWMLLDRFQNIAANVPGMLYEYQENVEGTERRISYTNDVVYDIFGITANEAMQSDASLLFEKIVKEDLPGIIASVGYSKSNLTVWKENFRIRKSNGQIVWVNGNSVPQLQPNGEVVWRGFIKDITESKIADREIQKLSQIAKRTSNGVVLTDMDRKIVWVNDGFVKITGFSLEESSGRKPGELLQTDGTDPATVAFMKEKFAANEGFEATILNRAKDGRKYWVEMKIQPFFMDGAQIGFMAVETDVTDRVEREAEQKKLIEQLTISLEDLTQFSYIVSHNLRAPLTNIIGLSGVLQKTLEQGKPSEIAKMILQSAKNLDTVLKDLNEMLSLKNQKLEYREIRLEAVCAEAVQLLEAQVKDSGAQIDAEFSEAPVLYSVKPYLVSIFYNMIGNAIKYCKKDMPPDISIASRTNGKEIVLEFADKGIGINLEKNADRVFGLYQRFNISKEGKGIGLFLTKSNVRLLGGEIEVASTYGEGTKFTIRLPIR